jgi:hypothetical protein
MAKTKQTKEQSRAKLARDMAAVFANPETPSSVKVLRGESYQRLAFSFANPVLSPHARR